MLQRRAAKPCNNTRRAGKVHETRTAVTGRSLKSAYAVEETNGEGDHKVEEIYLLRTVIQWIFRGLAIVAAFLATVQPVLGSFAFFRPGGAMDYETLHLVVGGILYNLVLLLVVLVLFTGFRRRWILISVCLVQYGLTHVQLRLGLGSNDDLGLLAYHVPVGVLIFFVSYLTVALGFGLHIEKTRA